MRLQQYPNSLLCSDLRFPRQTTLPAAPRRRSKSEIAPPHSLVTEHDLRCQRPLSPSTDSRRTRDQRGLHGTAHVDRELSQAESGNGSRHTTTANEPGGRLTAGDRKGTERQTENGTYQATNLEMTEQTVDNHILQPDRNVVAADHGVIPRAQQRLWARLVFCRAVSLRAISYQSE